MNVQVAHAVVHTPEQVVEIIEQALRVVAEVELTDDLRRCAFEQACILLGARTSVVSQQQLPSGLDLSGLRSGGGG